MEPKISEICNGMFLLAGFAEPLALHKDLQSVLDFSPLRTMTTRRGHAISAAMSNCGPLGWVSDRSGYRYQSVDPQTRQPWPDMPPGFQRLATSAAEAGGFDRFVPDACLINCYAPGAGMGSHQDADEADFSQPIVSVSLGLPARFFVQGKERKGRSIAVDLVSGDVVVWGGPARLYYHGVRPLKPGYDDVFGAFRFNLTFRRAA